MFRGTNKQHGPIVEHCSSEPISECLHASAERVTPPGCESGTLPSTFAQHGDDCSEQGRRQSRGHGSSTTAIPVKSHIYIEDSRIVEKIRDIELSNAVPNKAHGAIASFPPITPRISAVKTQDLQSIRIKPRKISMDGEGSPTPKKARVENDTRSREASSTNEAASGRPIAPTPSPMILLSTQQDELVLNPLHVFVRKQIEVFTATLAELGQPAPGRKQPIQLHQVGLRCIHCRHLPSRKRVKRAVCYPSSVGRVYHSVSDMKFDHFPLCKGLPDDIRKMFDSLRSEGNRSGEKQPNIRKSGCSSSTAQYYHDSALKMGMMDCSGGIFMSAVDSSVTPAPQTSNPPSPHQSNSTNPNATGAAQFYIPLHYQIAASRLTPQQQFDLAVMNAAVLMNRHPTSIPSLLQAMRSSGIAPTEADLPHLSPTTKMGPNISAIQTVVQSEGVPHDNTEKNVKKTTEGTGPKGTDHINQETVTGVGATTGEGTVCLSDPDDDQFLNPLHCFVRKHVELFTADEDDISAPAPGRKTRVILGQVGVRCIHCTKLPVKERVKRSVCYPPSVTGLYHSISNMKFDHFGICRGLPSKDREEFTSLKKSCNRRSTVGTKCASSASSTAQYYHDSAVRKGLVDTHEGIRFKGKANSDPTVSTMYPKLHTGISALMMAASHAA